MNRELQEFVRDALGEGHSRDTIHDKLLEAGWTDSDVTAGLHSFALVDFSIAVPRPRPYLYAREAFLYMVSFIALYVSAISFAIWCSVLSATVSLTLLMPGAGTLPASRRSPSPR